MILETTRLYLRELNSGDLAALARILEDEETMYAYNGAFTPQETQAWLDKQLARYRRDGFGLWAVVHKETGAVIGQCGLTLQDWKEDTLLEIGYLFQRDFWHQGFAVEAARACREYAFDTLGADRVCSIIRDTNLPSQRVAVRNGMRPIDTWTKHYKGVDMPHILFVVQKDSRTSAHKAQPEPNRLR